MMESYKLIREKVFEMNEKCENELLEINQNKQLNSQQYNMLMEEEGLLSSKCLELKKIRQGMLDKRLNVLRIMEILVLSFGFALTVRIMGHDILPIIQHIWGEDLGALFMIAGSLSLGMGELFLLGMFDCFITSKIINKIKKNKEYAQLSKEIEEYKSKIDLKIKEASDKELEYNQLVEKGNAIIDKISSNNNLISLLNSLIEKDEEAKIKNNTLVKKRVKDNN